MPGRRHRPLGASGAVLRQPVRSLTGIALALTVVLVSLTNPVAGQGATGHDPAALAPRVDHLGTYVWHIDAPDFGGFSGLDLREDGSRFTALSDRATLRWGRILRDAQGRIKRVEATGHARLKDSEGRKLAPGWRGDSEGLAVGSDGRLWISFEGLTRVVLHDRAENPAQPLPRPAAFKAMQRNSSLESLAILPDGTLLAIPERSGALHRPFPVWRYRDGAWDQPFSIPRSGNWLAVDADVGPDGRLYLLERDFMGLLGFRTRLRRFDLSDAGVSGEQVLLTSYPLQYDNLEGLAVWQDGQGIRVTMISDDNFSRLQRTELVEYRITD